MMWMAIGLAALVFVGLLLEVLARIVLMKMHGDGWDGND